MKRYLAIIALAAVALAGANILADTTEEKAVPDPNTIRLASLVDQRDRLSKQIREADAARNRYIAGVAPRTLEKINERQDSICLDLRSRLSEVVLEIKEISLANRTSMLTDSIVNILNQKEPAEGEKEELIQ